MKIGFEICPACGGRGGGTGIGCGPDVGCQVTYLKCDLCQGAKEVMAEIGARYRHARDLRNTRVELGMTQTEAASELGITARTMNEIESGRAEPTYVVADLKKAKERKGIRR